MTGINLARHVYCIPWYIVSTYGRVQILARALPVAEMHMPWTHIWLQMTCFLHYFFFFFGVTGEFPALLGVMPHVCHDMTSLAATAGCHGPRTFCFFPSSGGCSQL